jgi:predicted ArsR family transcriptional regulator
MARTVDRILHALQMSPGMTKEEIAERAFVSLNTLSGGGYLKDMKAQGLIYISGWRRGGSGAFVIPQYSVGRFPDYPRPEITSENREAPGMQRLQAAIEKFGPIDYQEAASRAGLSVNTVKNSGYLEALLTQGKIYISEWRRNRRGPMRPLYEAGEGRNQPRPSPYSGAEKSKAFRCRKAARVRVGNLAAQLGVAPPRSKARSSAAD